MYCKFSPSIHPTDALAFHPPSSLGVVYSENQPTKQNTKRSRFDIVVHNRNTNWLSNRNAFVVFIYMWRACIRHIHTNTYHFCLCQWQIEATCVCVAYAMCICIRLYANLKVHLFLWVLDGWAIAYDVALSIHCSYNRKIHAETTNLREQITIQYNRNFDNISFLFK